MRFSILFLFVSFSFSLFSQVPSDEYKLYWQDEFDGEELNTSKWKYTRLGKRRDAYNIEECATIQKGYLALRTMEHNDTIFSTMLSTEGRMETTYGYFEMKCLLQKEEGHWSAFWLQSSTFGKYIGNPEQSGTEIDIVEYLPNKPKRIQHALHYDGYDEHIKSQSKKIRNRKFRKNNWHTFGLEWTTDAYIFYVDGVETHRIEEAISQVDEYMILSLEVGDWAGDIQDAELPDYWIIDYVRVYKKE